MLKPPLRAASLVVALIIGMQAPAAFATDLGAALNFGLLSLKQGLTFGKGSALGGQGIAGGQSILLRANAAAADDLVATPGHITLKSGASAGNCITGGGKVTLAPDANCASEDTTGSNSELASFSTAITDIGAFVDAIKAQQPTLTIPAIKVAAHDASQIVDSVSGGLNIISTPSVTLKTDAGLTITGNSSDLVILAIAGNLKIGADAILSTAITSSTIPEDHLIVFVGGKIVSVGKNAVLNGTIIAPKATCTLAAGAASIGAYLCGKQITMQNEDAQGDDAAILFNPTVVTLP